MHAPEFIDEEMQCDVQGYDCMRLQARELSSHSYSFSSVTCMPEETVPDGHIGEWRKKSIERDFHPPPPLCLGRHCSKHLYSCTVQNGKLPSSVMCAMVQKKHKMANHQGTPTSPLYMVHEKKRDYFKYKLQMKEQEPEEEISETIELNSLCKSSEPYFTKNPGTIEELNIRAETSCLRSELHLQHNEPTLKLASFASIENGMFSSSLENLLNSSTTPMECTKSDHFLESKNTANITEDSIENPISLLEVSSMDIQQTNKNSVLFNTSTKTIEQFNTKENSVITIIVPTEFSEEPSLVASSIASPQQQLVKLENAEFKESIWKDMDSGAEVLQTEHSYCRHYIYRDHLWQKIAKLHSKITVLEVQERKTLSRLKSLEALIGQLKQENLLSEEKLRIVKNCFTTF
ncbi:THAP domain-containing protein 5 isoform X4 [Rhinatrema bivittatum]|uniref:THAP domain-containing protein 5 isoform X4 n=1 Tax=Rhinatrema bivittatum TaxID=194408 RepID=UPI00112A7FEC|nr:THAP domain-containing protein 5 isoform X4 [Rhinatrema bivittatum]XP_029470857.1 THAP domain-containing protein 5 isoform X4 [Rhinatrema bivittatum]XP_029470858.1 THAP domain-containing protein 5 isoform X4 [Rhinatrema bivittatum]